jgi:general secretion pathway protein A
VQGLALNLTWFRVREKTPCTPPVFPLSLWERVGVRVREKVMYNKFYGFKENPFEITPDPRFLYLSENHKEALAQLTYALREKKGFTVITGEVGTGKTLLVQTLLSKLNGNIRTAYLFNPRLDSTDFIQYICEDFGLNGQKKSKGEYITQLHHFLTACYANNENVVLIIDEAQNLDPELLEEVRLLTNLETPKKKLLQIILLGQPELNDILDNPQCRQLKQRVSLRYHIQPLKKEETEAYIEKRLKMAGAFDPYLFDPKAIDQIYKYTKGIPRLINTVCDNALLTGYANDQEVIGKSVIREVIRDLEGFSSKAKREYLSPIIFTVFVLFGIGVIFFLWEDSFFKGFKIQLYEALKQSIAFAETLFREMMDKFFKTFG